MPFSRLFYTHHVDLIIEEVESDVKDKATSTSMVVQVYDPQLACAYASLLDGKHVRTREGLAQALKDHCAGEKEARKWFVIKEYFNKING